MSYKARLFIVLWLAGMAGVLSFLLVDLSALITKIPAPEGMDIPEITPTLKFLSLLQPAVILSLAVLAGVACASKVGLSSPVAEAVADKKPIHPALRPQLIPGLYGGLAGGTGIVLMALLWKPFLPPEVLTRSAELSSLLPLPTRLLYGGITEELFLRWGLMTLLVWAGWRMIQKGEGRPKTAYFVAAILISSFVFAVGHLPIAFLFFPDPTVTLISYVIIANSMFGLIAGYLYWKKGLESAVIAHMLVHVVMQTADYFGALL